MKTVQTETTVHDIGFRGLVGGILGTVGLSLVAIVMGFISPGWTIMRPSYIGLWESCVCTGPQTQPWFRAVQAMVTIGLILMVFALIAVLVYMCVLHFKNITLIAMAALTFGGAVFLMIGLIVYAARAPNVHWSFVLTVIGNILCFASGILCALQIRNQDNLKK